MCATVQRSNLENFILNFCEFCTLKKNWLASALRRYDIRMNFWWRVDTGKSLSEASIFLYQLTHNMIKIDVIPSGGGEGMV